MSSGPSTITQQTRADLPQFFQPYAQNLLGQAQGVSQQPYPTALNQQVAPLTPTQIAGLGATTEQALQGSPAVNSAAQQLTDTSRGRYLDPTSNPAWAPAVQGITQAYQTAVAPQMDAAAARANALGSTGYNEQVGINQQALGNALGQTWGNLYNQERGQQMTAAGLAPNITTAGYIAPQQMLNAGALEQGYNQQLLNTGQQNAASQIQWPYSQLGFLASMLPVSIGGQYNSRTTGQNPYQGSPIASAIGLGSLGLGAYGALNSAGLLGGATGAGIGYGAGAGLTGAGGLGLTAGGGLGLSAGALGALGAGAGADFATLLPLAAAI